MQERHENEQYFFSAETTSQLASFAAQFPNPCCICAPSIGKALTERGVPVRILDIDERFANLPGFRHFDLRRPDWLDEEFGIIICDPPFFNLSLSRLFAALRLLAHNNYKQPLLISYLTRRSTQLLSTFARFGLTRTGYRPHYQTVAALPHNEIEFFGNLSPAQHAELAQLT